MVKGKQAFLAAAIAAFLAAVSTQAGQDAYHWAKRSLTCAFSDGVCLEEHEEEYSQLFNINGPIDSSGNRPGLDLVGRSYVVPDKEFGKRVLSATIIACPFEDKWEIQKVTPNGNKLLVELVPSPKLLADLANNAQPFHVTFKVRYEV